MNIQKTITAALWIATLALSLSISCAKQEAEQTDVLSPEASGADEEQPQEDLYYCTISVGLPKDPMKTTVSPEGKVVWSVGDHIGVFVGETLYDFVLVSGAGSENAVFKCTTPGSLELDGSIAVYPYHAGLTFNSGTGAVQVYIPDEQDYACSSAPMISTLSKTAEGGYHYFFRNLSGIFQFTYNNVPPEAKKFKFTAGSDIAGTFTLASTSDNLTTDTGSAEETKSVMITLPVARPDGSVTVQIPAPVGTYSGFSVVLCEADGTEISGTRRAPEGASIIARVSRRTTIKPAITLPEGLKVLWAWDNGGSLAQFDCNVPAIDAQGNVYIMANSANLYKVDRNGNKLWAKALTGMSGTNQGSPSLEPDGSAVYAAGGATTGALYAFTADGTQKWNFSAWGPVTSQVFGQTLIAVGDGNNIYVACNRNSGSGNDDGTVLSISKSSGSRVAYLAYNANATPDFLGTCSGSISVSALNEVAFATKRGAYIMHKSLLDSPSATHDTYGKYLGFAYRDHVEGTVSPYNWSNFGGSSSQGVICGRKGPNSGKHVIISCPQQDGRMMVMTCTEASEMSALNAYVDTTPIRVPDDAGRHYYWRYPGGGANNSGEYTPALQTRGGLVFGHDDLLVLIPLQEAPEGQTNKMWGPAGIATVYVKRTDTEEINKTSVVNVYIADDFGSMRDWRFNIRSSTPDDPTATPTHSLEPNAGVSGSPAVDNNGWVHVASHDCYHILDAPAKETGEQSGQMYTGITSKARVHWVDLLNASGLLDYEVTSATVLSSVKIGYDGRMYVNVNVNGSKGVTVCMTFPGVTGPDPTSSWPQKGADPRNSCYQVHDPSTWTNNTGNTISWD